MGLKLQTVATRQGWTWARDGARLFLRRPLAFSAMLLLFLLVSGVWMALPVVGCARAGEHCRCCRWASWSHRVRCCAAGPRTRGNSSSR